MICTKLLKHLEKILIQQKCQQQCINFILVSPTRTLLQFSAFYSAIPIHKRIFFKQYSYSNQLLNRTFTCSRTCFTPSGSNFANNEFINPSKHEADLKICNFNDNNKKTEVLAEDILRRGKNANLDVTLERNLRTGERLLRIIKVDIVGENKFIYKRIIKLGIPNEAYEFVRLLDKLILKFVQFMEGKGIKQLPKGTAILEESIVNESNIEICLSLNRHPINGNLLFAVYDNKTKKVKLDGSIVPPLRELVAEMLTKHDGTQTIQPMPDTPDELNEKGSGVIGSATAKFKPKKRRKQIISLV